MYLSTPSKFAAIATLILATCVLASCSAGDTSTPSPGSTGTQPASQSRSTAAARVPETFTSPEYGYTVRLPVGWTTNQAHEKWDGTTLLSDQSFGVDHFIGTSDASSFGVALRWKHGLSSFARFLIASTQRFHGDTCPSKPNTDTGIAIGGRHGVLLEYNCGILINIAATVRHGIAYEFLFRDPSVHAAFDPTDHADFVRILTSVEFPV